MRTHFSSICSIPPAASHLYRSTVSVRDMPPRCVVTFLPPAPHPACQARMSGPSTDATGVLPTFTYHVTHTHACSLRRRALPYPAYIGSSHRCGARQLIAARVSYLGTERPATLASRLVSSRHGSHYPLQPRPIEAHDHLVANDRNRYTLLPDRRIISMAAARSWSTYFSM